MITIKICHLLFFRGTETFKDDKEKDANHHDDFTSSYDDKKNRVNAAFEMDLNELDNRYVIKTYL